MPDALLAINAGSSSVKFSLAHMDSDDNVNRIISGELEGIGTAPKMHAQGADGHIVAQFDWSTDDAPSYDVLLGKLIGWIENHLGENRLIAVGHRVAHGGKSFTAPVLVIPAIMEALETLVPLAPLHQPPQSQPHSIDPDAATEPPSGRMFRHGLSPYAAICRDAVCSSLGL